MSIGEEAIFLARSIFELRKRRAQHLPDAVLSEASWNILLALFVADADGRQITSKEAAGFAEVPITVGKRWIIVLAQEGLLEGNDPTRPDEIIGLTPAGVAAVRACMVDAQEYLQSRRHRSAAG